MSDFSDLEKQIKKFKGLISHFSRSDQEKILKAFDLAAKNHQGQRRLSGIDYLIHLVRVANLLVEEVGLADAPAICAALLHDTLEDTRLKPKVIRDSFGEDVLVMVKALTIKKGEGYEHFVSRVLADCQPVQLIKYADRLDNCRDWQTVIKRNPRFVQRGIAKVEKYYLPLAPMVDSSGFFEKELKYNVAKARRGLGVRIK